MKKYLCLLVIAVMSCGMVKAQKVLLPYGQLSHQPWSGKFFYSNNGDAGPADDWYVKNFDDSSWDTIEGPISSTEGGLGYYNTIWKAGYGTYWVRRHFTVSDLSQVRELFCYIASGYWDYYVAYLNGKLIFDDYYGGTQSVFLDETVLSYLTEGENVLAIRVSDSGGDAFLDCGIYGYSLVNSTFENDNGWTGSYERYGYDNNTIGYHYGKTFRCEQTIEGVPGLYRLSANACGMEYYNEYNTAYAHQNDEIPAKLFLGNYEKAIPSAFSELSDVDYGYCWNVGEKFVPYYVDNTPWAFNRDMYHCELWSFAQPDANGKITLGIYSNAANDINRWAAWDNLDVTFYSETDVTIMLDSIVNVVNGLDDKPQDAEVKKQANTLVANAKTSNNYYEKAAAFADIMHFEPTLRKSIKAYEDLSAALAVLNTKLGEVNDYTSPSTISEATSLRNEVRTAHTNGSYTNDGVTEAISKMEKMVIRLGYTYLDIAVTTPGAMGDSILSKVENFTDVQSIKIFGTLNNEDLITLKNRLTQLREIDMSDMDMVEMPDELFYDHTLLEIVKLPAFLKSIGSRAFYQCYGIRQIVFPSTLTTIKEGAFRECDNLQEVIIPEGVISVGSYAFFSCDGNKHVKLPSTLESIGYSVFQYNIRLEKVDFTEGLTHIEDMAFYECYALDNIKFPKSLYHIGNSAFAYDRSLSSIVFNEGLFQIEDNAFYDCDALTEIVLPSTLVLAYASPFDYCDNLMKVTCLSIEPPYMQDQIPYGLSMDGRELYVPALSINTYKQTSGWDKFQTIKPIDYLPENISVLSDMKLTLPQTIPANYKPNVSIIHDLKGTSTWQYGSLTVNGEGTLSISDFSMMWNPNYQYVRYNDAKNYCTLITNSHIRADNVNIDLYLRNNIWTFISLPFDVKVSDILTLSDGTTNWVIRKYDGQKRANGETAETWLKLTSDDILNAYEGYIIQGSRYVDGYWQEGSGFCMKAVNNANKNNIFRTTDITVTLNEYESEFAHNRSWNLIGNPYPCYYDTRFMDFEAPITVWNMRNSTYEAYSPADDSYILCPGEAFFVQRPISNGNIVFNKDGRQTNRDVRVIEAPARANLRSTSATSPNRTIVNLSLSDGNSTDRTRIVLNNHAMLQYEMDKDASKFMSTDATVPQIYTSSEGVNYAINERPCSDGIVNLGVYAGSEGLYTIALASDVEGYSVVLEDKAMNKSVGLSADNEYTFSTEAGTYSNRFVLHFNNGTTGFDGIPASVEDNTTIYSIDGIKMETPSKNDIYIQNGKIIMLDK